MSSDWCSKRPWPDFIGTSAALVLLSGWGPHHLASGECWQPLAWFHVKYLSGPKQLLTVQCCNSSVQHSVQAGFPLCLKWNIKIRYTKLWRCKNVSVDAGSDNSSYWKWPNAIKKVNKQAHKNFWKVKGNRRMNWDLLHDQVRVHDWAKQLTMPTCLYHCY